MKKYLAVMAALTLLITACGDDGDASADDDGGGGEAEGEPIVIGNIADLSGATGDVGTPYSEGIRGYVDWRNEQGGIEGRPIELEWEDYQYDVAIAEQLYTDYTAAGAVAIQGWGTADTEALRGRVNEDEVPFMSASYSEELTFHEETPYNFVVGTSYSDQMRIALKWIHEQDPGAEVAVFHHDSPFGTSPVEDGEQYIEDEGLDLGYQAHAMAGGATDFIGELRRVDDDGVSYIVVQNVESPAALLASDIADQELDIQLVLLNWAAGEQLIELAGDASEGAIGVQPWTPTDIEVPGQEDASEYLEGEGEELANLQYTQGWWKMALMADALESIVDSGEEVTGPALASALEEVEDFDTQGVSLPIDLTPRDDGRRVGMVCSPMYVVEDGAWEQEADEYCP
ncbi:MAG: ABC transporter substrate-binding protein [Nitriliruptoraceae bacterium]